MSQLFLVSATPVSSEDLGLRPPQPGGAKYGWHRARAKSVGGIPMTAQEARTG